MDVCRLSALQALELSNSSFSGPLTFNTSGYASLLSFTAFANKLSGPLPTTLPANLTTLGVGQNQLNGTLPAYNSSTLSTLQAGFSMHDQSARACELACSRSFVVCELEGAHGLQILLRPPLFPACKQSGGLQLWTDSVVCRSMLTT